MVIRQGMNEACSLKIRRLIISAYYLSPCEVALTKLKIILEIYSCEKGLVSVDLTTLGGTSLEGLGKPPCRTLSRASK